MQPADFFEARLGHEEFGGETHVFSAAYREDEFDEILRYADHVVFNSPSQVKKYGERVKAAGRSAGLRLEPRMLHTGRPCDLRSRSPGSRLGTTKRNLESAGKFETELLPYLDGFHFHTLCEQNSDALETTLAALEEKFGNYLPRLNER